MSVFESLGNTTNKASDIAEKYINTSKQYIRLKVFQQLTLTLSMATKFAIIGGLVAFSTIFIAIASAMLIGEVLHNTALGYLIVGLIFLVMAILIYTLRKRIDKHIITIISRKFFD